MKQHTVSPESVDTLIFDALLSSDQGARAAARSTIRARAEEAGIQTASLSGLYAAFATGAERGFTVPAINVRGLSYDFIRAIVRGAMKQDVGAFIIELARSEMRYGEQTSDDLVVAALAAALREGFRGPLFIQGDHFQIDPSKDAAAEVAALERLIDESCAAGMRHIDIDASKTVDPSKESPEDRQARNAELTAHFTQYIRSRFGDDVLIGAEIGEIGGRISTPDDLRAFMAQYRRGIDGLRGVMKVAIQSGTSHGGIPNPDGTVKHVNVDAGALRDLSRIAREEFGLAGAVQHGASTLSEEQIGSFPELGVAEVHLSTEFQNIVFDHPQFPRELREEMRAYVFEHFVGERKPDMTDEQFMYKQRKRLWGPFKRAFIELPADVRTALGDALEYKVGSLFQRCRVSNTREAVSRSIH